jgi:hypothetical protein
MRREVRRLATVSALLFSTPGSFAASPPAKPGPAPVARPGPVSGALCGRETAQRVNAEALDHPDPAILPVWRTSKVAELELWLKAPVCLHATSIEAARFDRRRGALGQLRSRIERARATELVDAVVAGFPGPPLQPDEWPTSAECPACAALRRAAQVAADTASRWPKQKQAEAVQMGPRLDAAARRESLIAELCAAKPSPGAREEIKKRFQYYSWTAGGAKLFEIAAWFEQLKAAAGCRGR